jgi:hypothetical protein
MATGQTLISVEITTDDKIWNRTYLSTYIPSEEQYTYYYTVLCGFTDAKVTCTTISVPEGFNEALLKPLDTAPTVFPLSDLETEPADKEKRQHYKDFIKQLVQMEVNRISLNFFVEAPKTSSYLTKGQQEKIQGYRDWVKDLLGVLETELAIVPVTNTQAQPTVGWIIAPSTESTRRTNGYRLITNERVGQLWEPLLGTDHFPDLVIAQKLHTASWDFQHEMSTALYKNILNWYLHAKNASIEDGVSAWMPQIDTELRTLAAAFLHLCPAATPGAATVAAEEHTQLPDPEYDMPYAMPAPKRRGRPPKPAPLAQSNFDSQTLRTEFIHVDIPKGVTPHITTIKDVLRCVEELLAPASMFTTTTEPCTVKVFCEFVKNICAALDLAEEEIQHETVAKVFQRWETNKMGFRPDLYPIIAEWYEMWRTIIRTNATIERVEFFNKTVSLGTVATTKSLPTKDRDHIVEGWLKIFTETNLIQDPMGSVQAVDLHEQCRQFCLRFTPESLFGKAFTPMSIGPFFTKRGYQSVRRSHGRFVQGIRYRRPEEKTLSSVHITNTIHHSTMTAASGATIKHYSSTTEINLGML